jgi:hypothetical protein
VIFGSQLHTHLTGIRVFTRHVRDGRELPELNRDNHYSTHFQEIRSLKQQVRILPVSVVQPLAFWYMHVVPNRGGDLSPLELTHL